MDMISSWFTDSLWLSQFINFLPLTYVKEFITNISGLTSGLLE